MNSRRLPLAARPSLGNSNKYNHNNNNISASNNTDHNNNNHHHRHHQNSDPISFRHKNKPSPDQLLPDVPRRFTGPHLRIHLTPDTVTLPQNHPFLAADMDGGGGIEVGDAVDVPGGMTGIIKFIGPVKGKNGMFAGVELSRDFATRGKNDGDVDGIRYFSTSVPGSGIFLPAHRATKRESPTLSSSTFPPTPTTPSYSNFDLNRNGTATGHSRTPPTPSIPKFSQSAGPGAPRPNFSQSVGSGARASSPQQHKPKSRGSLPRAESPLRRAPSLQPLNPSSSGNAASTLTTPGRPSLKVAKAAPNPAQGNGNSNGSNRAVKPVTPAPVRSNSRNQGRLPDAAAALDSTPTANPRFSNGPRRMSQPRTSMTPFESNNNEDVTALKRSLEERDRQLKEQASSLAEMESSLAELQSLMANTPEVGKHPGGVNEMGADGADIVQLRITIREKNERIAALTAEFDSHRADFRSTIDTLEMASTETERVYEKRVQELLQEVEELQSKGDDVATVAAQLKQLEDLVQELEEGLEDARRGEAEARGEVEFLRGEVERARLELRREREKAARALKGAGAAVGGDGPSTPSAQTSGGGGGPRDIEQRDDEIRGLKAIIHSLSSGADLGTPQAEKTINLGGENGVTAGEMASLKQAVEALQREKGELQGLIDRKKYREEELERENARLRESGMVRDSHPLGGENNGANGRPTYHSHKDSSSTITATTAPSHRNSANSTAYTARRPDSASIAPLRPGSAAQEQRDRGSGGGISSPNSIMDDSVSAADTDTLWCEICEQSGHDILTCTQMFGNVVGAGKPDLSGNLDNSNNNNNGNAQKHLSHSPTRNSRGASSSYDGNNRPPSVPLPLPLKPHSSQGNLRAAAAAAAPPEFHSATLDVPAATTSTSPGGGASSSSGGMTGADKEHVKDMGNGQTTTIESTAAETGMTSTTKETEGVKSIFEEGPAAGKSSGKVDLSKWCALCEKDGHESVDCPFEEEF